MMVVVVVGGGIPRPTTPTHCNFIRPAASPPCRPPCRTPPEERSQSISISCLAHQKSRARAKRASAVT
jgi:hypothetical protein